MRFFEHGGVVVGIARGDHGEVEFLETTHGLALLIGHAQVVIHHAAVGIGFQTVTEQRRPAELAHQRMSELVKSVGQDHDLIALAQRVEKGACAGHRSHFGDHRLNLRQPQPVAGQRIEPITHQHIVIRLVARGAAQFGHAGTLGEFNPDFGDEHPFEVETDDLHNGLPEGQR